MFDLPRTARLLTATATLWALTVSPSGAYCPPSGPSNTKANINNPQTHGAIILKALDVLKADGRTDAYAFFDAFRQQLLDGVRKADEGNGAMTLVGKDIPRKSYTHFYNPDTGQGFRAHLWKDAQDVVALGSLAPWKYFTLKGPHPSACDMTDWLYAQAVQKMRAGDLAAAMTDLGEALHLLADCTVPQHATDQGAEQPGSNHQEYEAAVNSRLNQIQWPAKNGAYHADWRPGQFTESAAKSSAPYLAQAKSSSASVNMQAAQPMVALAVQLSAGLLDRFYRTAGAEDFHVAVVTISNVKAISGYRIVLGKKIPDPTLSLDAPDAADFYARVSVNNRTYATGVVDGTDDMFPNILASYVWVFPNWVAGPAAAIPMKIEIWDQDLGTDDDHADINPASGKPDLNFTYDLGANALAGDVTAAGNNAASVSKTSSGTPGDAATVSFECARVPVLPGVSCTASPAGATVTLTASCPAAAQYKFCVSANNGATWTDLCAYGAGKTFAWSPAGGQYLVKAKAKPAAGGESNSLPIRYAVSQVSLSAVTLSVAPSSPRPAGTAITLTAGATGGTNPQFKFSVSANNGASWSDLRGFASGKTCPWTGTTAGAYLLRASAREGAAGPEITSAPVTFTLAAPLSGVALSASPASPRVVNTAVTLTATPTGGAQVEYAFSVAVVNSSGSVGGYSNLGSWQASPKYVWQNLSAGTFKLRVTARETGATATFTATVTFKLTPQSAKPKPI